MAPTTTPRPTDPPCPSAASGNAAHGTSPDLHTTESLRHFLADLVDKRNIHDLKRILVDFQWIRKHAETGVHGIVHLVTFGYDKLLTVKPPALNVFEREGYRHIRNALMLIRPVLHPGIPTAEGPSGIAGEGPTDCAHLAAQLYGRLLKASHRFSVVSILLESIRIHAKRPWLRPLNPCFDSPKTDMAIAVTSGVDAVSSAIAMSHDGELVLTAGDNHALSSNMTSTTASYSVRVWDVATGNCVSTIRGTHTSSVLYLAITRNKKHVISCAGSQLIFWKIMDNEGHFIQNVTEAVCPEHRVKMVFSITVLPDSERAVAAHQNDFKIWNVVNGKCEAKFEKPESMIYSLDITPDGKYLVSGEQNGSISIWNIETQRKVLFFNNQGYSVFSVAFMVEQEAENGTDASLKVVSGSADSILRVWTLPAIQPKAKAYCCSPRFDDLKVDLKVNGGGSVTFNSIRCAGKGTIFTGSDDGVVRMWKMKDGVWTPTMLSQDARERLGSKAAAATPKSSVFIAASNDGRLVAASTNKPVVSVFDIGQYEETLRAQKGILDRSYFPYRRGSVSFTDMGKVGNSDGLPIDLGAYFLVGPDSDVTAVKSTELSTPGNLLQVLLFDTHERWIAFDENILGRQGGIFVSQDTNETRRRGVAVTFREGGLAFFEVEHDPENVSYEKK